jgi:hypothetical protein
MTSVLGPETQRRVEMLFPENEREEAVRLLSEWEIDGDRLRIAALKLSDGNLVKLREAIAVGKNDWRDLLYIAGFANDTKKHLRWIPGQVEKTWWGTLTERFKRTP